jgi:hypothetical protein
MSWLRLIAASWPKEHWITLIFIVVGQSPLGRRPYTYVELPLRKARLCFGVHEDHRA